MFINISLSTVFLFVSISFICGITTATNPCIPFPCGPNSQCRVIKDQVDCSCIPGFVGVPPNCTTKCVTNSECPPTQACIIGKCMDPCIGICGANAECKVVDHNPACNCAPRHTGDPFYSCVPFGPPPIKPCTPSPCGPNSQCREIKNEPHCNCLLESKGIPPNCRPECVSNSECANHLACFNQKCRDPCHGVCGQNTECRVVSHTPNCVCISGYSGNPFHQCSFISEEPCIPSSCGVNAVCKERNGTKSCVCLPEYMGNPYEGCGPKCRLNKDCEFNRACINQICTDPCRGLCVENANCYVDNHEPHCYCNPGFTGDAFTDCRVISPEELENPCERSPCGPHSHCRVINLQVVCSCLPNYVGSPPGCRLCVDNFECSSNLACVGQKCIDPCPGTCGVNATCAIKNRNPVCSCEPGSTGDPFLRCSPLQLLSNQTEPAPVD